MLLCGFDGQTDREREIMAQSWFLEIWCSVFSDYERYFYDVVKTLYRANGCRREMFNSAIVLPKRKRSLESAEQALKENLS